MNNNELQNEINKLKETVSKLNQKIEFFKKENDLLREQVSFFKAFKFASKSEKISEEQLLLFNEAELQAEDLEEEDEKITIAEHTRSQNTNRGKRLKLPDNLPREEVIIDLKEDEKICPHDGSELKCIGEEVSEKLDIIPAKIKVIRTIRKKYACPCCDDCLKTPSVPLSILPKSMASEGLIAFIATTKYVDGVPLYRQEAVMKRYGIELPRNTMSRWMIGVAEKLQPLKQILLEELIASNYLHCDETVVQVLKEDGKKAHSNSYMWVVAREGPRAIVFFDYSPSRSGQVISKILLGFNGYLQVDGYSGYNQISRKEGVTRVGCMSHCRRYFYKAYRHSKSKNLGAKGLSFIQKLFKIEERIQDLSVEKRYEIRQQEAKPILEEMKKWLDEKQTKVSPKGFAGEALSYTLNEWDYLIKYLDNGMLNISNDFVERSIRPFTIGRKNWVFSDTPRGADASALWYSLVETAKLNKRDPYQYLKYVLENIVHAETLEDYLKLLPFEIK